MERPRLTIGAEHNKRVYINPYFKGNRPLSQVQANSSMHINPKFSHQLSEKITTSEANATRIHINPNFIRTTQPSIEHIKVSLQATSSTFNSDKSSDTSETKLTATYLETAVASTSISSPVAPNVTKSRYCLVRKNNEKKITIKELQHKKTYKINRYKSMLIQDLKKNINYHDFNNTKVKTTPKTCFATATKTTKYATSPRLLSSHYTLDKNKPHAVPNQYRFVNSSTSALISSSNRRSSLAKNTPRSTKSRVKIGKKIFKKNNIPCPLYRKYGTCLRNSQGDCEYLHDRKHVSICRKFVKGICFDNACLLSHEISKEKMPTCSFYLRGMCTKEDCPYLHVKLNENTQICCDFVKGYCEKGDECLNRHINVCPDLATKGSCHINKCPYPHKITKNVTRPRSSYKVNQKGYKLKKDSKVKGTENKNNLPKDEPASPATDCRYYKEVTGGDGNNVTAVEVIKPSRCKLGTLPSFIQL